MYLYVTCTHAVHPSLNSSYSPLKTKLNEDKRFNCLCLCTEGLIPTGYYTDLEGVCFKTTRVCLDQVILRRHNFLYVVHSVSALEYASHFLQLLLRGMLHELIKIYQAAFVRIPLSFDI